MKGILHPADAEKAVSLGIDGILVSNHGGRQIEALPPPIDCVPAIAKAVGSKATVLFDSGVRSGTDVARALALGANAALAGKAFLWGLGALGAEGPGHVIDLLIDELQSALGQIGAHSPGRGAQRHGPASGRAALLICARGRGHRAGRPVKRAPLHCQPGIDSMSAIAEPAARRRRRPPRQAQRAGAGGRAGAGRRQQHGDRLDRRHRRRDAGARPGPRDAAVSVHGGRHVARHAAARLSGARLRPPLRAADRHGGRARSRASISCAAVLQGSFAAVSASARSAAASTPPRINPTASPRPTPRATRSSRRRSRGCWPAA